MILVGPLGDHIAQQYLAESGVARVARYRSGKAHLLDDPETYRAKCGSQLLKYDCNTSKDAVLGAGEVWCYSCLGNALEWIERDRAHAH